MHLLERSEQHLYAGVSLSAPYKDERPEPVFTYQQGNEHIKWEGGTPSHKTGWKEINGVRVACTHYPTFGFMTEDEVWAHRKKYPRDCL